MKALTILASSIALLGAQPAFASEAYVVPDAVTPWVFEGGVSFTGGITLTCDATIEFSGPNDASDTSPPFSHTDVSNLSAIIALSGGFLGLCASVSVQPLGPGDISYSGGTFTFDNVVIFFPGSNCSGNLSGAWNEGATPQTLTVSSTLSGTCMMNGVFNLTAPGSGNAVGLTDGDHNPHQ